VIGIAAPLLVILSVGVGLVAVAPGKVILIQEAVYVQEAANQLLLRLLRSQHRDVEAPTRIVRKITTVALRYVILPNAPLAAKVLMSQHVGLTLTVTGRSVRATTDRYHHPLLVIVKLTVVLEETGFP